MFIEKRHHLPSSVPTNAKRAFGVDLVGTICVVQDIRQTYRP